MPKGENSPREVTFRPVALSNETKGILARRKSIAFSPVIIAGMPAGRAGV